MVFCKVNIIVAARQFSKFKDVLRSRPTALSLAGSVLTRIEKMQDPLTQSKRALSKPDFCADLEAIHDTFPRLRSGTVYV